MCEGQHVFEGVCDGVFVWEREGQCVYETEGYRVCVCVCEGQCVCVCVTPRLGTYEGSLTLTPRLQNLTIQFCPNQ